MLVLKTIMCVFNSVIFLIGGAAMLVGILVEFSSKYQLAVLDKIENATPRLAQVANVGYLLIAVGAILAITGFLGCCGAFCESKCMLLIYFIIVCIVFLVEVIGAVIILVFKPTAQKLLDEIRGKVADSIKSSYGQNEVFTKAWNQTMNLINCCGYNNYTDFTDSPFVKHTLNYPDNCCSEKSEQCSQPAAENPHVLGCFDGLVKLVEKNANLLAGAAICIAVVEVFAMIVSILLYKN